ncbi:MAG TPA: transglycosylase SLT domain-containing protein [Terriglobales bacterium]|nr:transglycosylase SLT domain-containing protein [Terriglobales bacterium]
MRRVLFVSFIALALGCSVMPAPGVFRGKSVRLDSEPQRRDALRLGFEKMQQRHNEQAAPYAGALLEAGYPGLEDYVLYLNGELAARLNQPKRARAAFVALLSRYSQSVLADRSAARLGEILQQEGLDQQARPLLERAKLSEHRESRAAAQLILGRIALRMGDADSAYRSFQSARQDGAGTAAAQTAKDEVRKLRAQMPSLVPQGSEAVDEVKLLLAEGDAADAEREAQRAARNSEGEDLAQLRDLLGRALLAQGRLEEAFVSWWQIVEETPYSRAAPEALHRIGSTLWNRDRDDAAARVFRQLLDRYASHSRAADSLYALGRIAQSAGRNGEAIATHEELLRRYPNSSVAYDAEWRIGWIAYEQQDWQQAAVRFARLAERSRDRERDAANYWRARAHHRAGRAERARELYGEIAARQAGYYSLLARGRLESASRVIPLSFEVPVTPAAEAVADVDPGTAPESFDRFHLERWRELRAAGLRQYARGELDAIADQASGPGDTLFLLRAYQATDGHGRAIRMAQKLGAGRVGSADYQSILYPLAFWTLVQREAEAAAIDPLLVIALMRQESMFDPAARSPANAYGLMQLLPATAKRVSMLADGREIDTSTITEPSVNVHLGTRYLRQLIDRYQGNIFKALAAYNGGEGAVDKWQQRNPAAEIDEFVETISYRETRDYVKKVVGNYDTYRRLYAAH